MIALLIAAGVAATMSIFGTRFTIRYLSRLGRGQPPVQLQLEARVGEDRLHHLRCTETDVERQRLVRTSAPSAIADSPPSRSHKPRECANTDASATSPFKKMRSFGTNEQPQRTLRRGDACTEWRRLPPLRRARGGVIDGRAFAGRAPSKVL